ncbi:hypothetical protein C5167_011442 [Papaver somniferum]|uniref:Bet v I/Major latex protein domain-containing protein n=2 Tax=Papaver somniferum TaxID=3469 RepID=A0A4Y7K736_PAPSO|nr:S-norcoclaurine synthase 2-like isoform X1 [Papaver somniferum]RZC67749.1 hypothetical protein C5167_011442 [Papaver somniferum]
MRYELINEFDVNASADDVWEVYSSPNLPKLIVDLLPGMFERIDYVEGNGGLGTVLRLVYPPGTVPRTYKEKFVTIDKSRRLKEVQQMEGGYLDMGVSFYMDSFEIIEQVGCNSCTIKSTTKYEINDDELAKKVSPLISVDSLVNMARGISKYVLKKQNSRSSHKHDPKKKVHEHGHPSADEDKHVHGRDRSFHR